LPGLNGGGTAAAVPRKGRHNEHDCKPLTAVPAATTTNLYKQVTE